MMELMRVVFWSTAIIILALVTRLFLIPIEKVIPCPFLIEELTKAFIILLVFKLSQKKLQLGRNVLFRKFRPKRQFESILASSWLNNTTSCCDLFDNFSTKFEKQKIVFCGAFRGNFNSLFF